MTAALARAYALYELVRAYLDRHAIRARERRYEAALEALRARVYGDSPSLMLRALFEPILPALAREWAAIPVGRGVIAVQWEFAHASTLDAHAGFAGLTRAPGESDEALRDRLRRTLSEVPF